MSRQITLFQYERKHQRYARIYQKHKSEEHDKRLMKQLVRTIQSAGYCWRCRRIILPRGKKYIKQHMEQYHSY